MRSTLLLHDHSSSKGFIHVAALSYARPLLAALLLAAALLAQACSSDEPPAPTPTPTVVASADSAMALEKRTMAYFQHLPDEVAPRDTASGGKLRAAGYLEEQFRELGYVTRL